MAYWEEDIAKAFDIGDYTYTPRIYHDQKTIKVYPNGSTVRYSLYTWQPIGDIKVYVSFLEDTTLGETEYEYTFTTGTAKTYSGQPFGEISYDPSTWTTSGYTYYGSITVVNRLTGANDFAWVALATPSPDIGITATDKTKVSYATPPSSVTNGGITYNVASFNYAYANCTNLVTAPTIPNAIRGMQGCFMGCTSLKTVPNIPSNPTLYNAFNGCIELTGNIEAYNDTIYSANGHNFFDNTVKDIYILNGAGTQGVEDAWTAECGYYPNVHYEANDNPRPDITATTPLRVEASGDKITSVLGTYAYLKATVILYETIPYGWHNKLGTKSITMDGTAISPTWVISNAWKLTADTDIKQNKNYYTLAITTVVSPDVSDIADYYELDNGVYSKTADLTITVGKTYYTIVATKVATPVIADIGTYYEVYLNRYTLETWINVGDVAKHEWTLSVSDDITDDTNTTVLSNTSTMLTLVLNKSYKLVDYYHDPNTGTEGMAVGKYAESADLFECAMPTSFLDMTAQEVDDFIDSIGGGGDPVADVVVEQGIDGIWTYRKWSSGIAECWGTSTKSTATTMAEYVVSFPTGLFISAPVLSACGGMNGTINSGVRYAQSTAVRFDVWLTSEASQSSWLHVYAIGKWK